MSSALLVHWNEAEARPRLEQLRAAGYEVQRLAPPYDKALKDVRANPPDFVVIDLTRQPSNGKQIATFFRSLKSTRRVPLLILDGEPEKVEALRQLIPDATYSTWKKLKSSIKQACASVPAAPANPGRLAGYSGTPLPKKLGIKDGSVVALLNAPDGFEETLTPLPTNVTFHAKPKAGAGVVVLFCDSRRALVSQWAVAANSLGPKGRLWVAWPKKASGIETDLTETFVRTYGLDQAFVDYKICAIDATWSGLCFARRG